MSFGFGILSISAGDNRGDGVGCCVERSDGRHSEKGLGMCSEGKE